MGVKIVSSSGNKADTKVSFSADLISKVSKNDDDAGLMLCHIKPGTTPGLGRKCELTEAASRLIIHPNLSEQVLSLEDPASEEIFGKSIAYLDDTLGYSRIDSSSFKTFTRDAPSALLSSDWQDISSNADITCSKPRVLHKEGLGPEPRRDFTSYEFTSSMEINKDTCSAPQLSRLSALLTSSTYSTDASYKPAATPTAPALSLGSAYKLRASSLCARQISQHPERKCTMSKAPAMTSANIQRTVRSRSPLNHTSPSMPKISCFSGLEDLPIRALCALDRGCWFESALTPEVAPKKRGSRSKCP